MSSNGGDENGEANLRQEFVHVPPGKFYLKRSIAEASIEQDEHESAKLRARRIFSVAEMIGVGDKDFLHVGYTGVDAFEAFQRDFVKFSSVKNTNAMRLLCYNSSLPALVFHDALVPVANIFEKNQYSPLLYVYLCHQFARTANSTSNRAVLSELWIDPSDGSLHSGPRVTMDIGTNWVVSLKNENKLMTDQQSSLAINVYRDEQAVFDFLSRHLETRPLFKGICLAIKVVDQWVPIPIEDVLLVSSLDTRTIYRRSTLAAVARICAAKESQPYLYKVMGLPAAVQKSKVITEDGFIRFTFQPQDINVLDTFSLRYTLISQEALAAITETWLSQAHGVFKQLGFQSGESTEDYSLPGMFRLYLHRETNDTAAYRTLDQPIHLFISPIPHLRAYWSSDAQGKEELSHELRSVLGLPTFSFSARFMWISWDRRVYDAVQKLQIRNGFDATTTDFAESLGYTPLQVVYHHDRFHEVQGEVECPVTEDPTSLVAVGSKDKFNIDTRRHTTKRKAML